MRRSRVFLVNLGRRTVKMPQATPPMGILCLAAYLRSKLDVELLLMDQRVENASAEAVVQRAADFGADVVGLSVMTPYSSNLGFLTEGLRTALPEAFIVLGGPHVSAFEAGALAGNVADAAVPFEGECALEQVVRARQEGADLTSIPGLLWRNGGDAINRNSGSIPFIEDIDALPFPAYDLLDVRKYWALQPMQALPPHKYISLFSSRGCPCKCTYCHAVFGKRFRASSPERLVAEVEHFVKMYKITDFEFLDDIFNFDRKRVLEICDLIAKRNLKLRINFPNAVRTDALTEEVMDALVGAGLYHSAFALESGSPRMQQLMRKHMDIDKFLRGVKWATDRGVYAHGFAMLGFPTETEEEMEMTLEVACNSRLHSASFFTVVPFPGTELYATVEKTAPDKLKNIDYNYNNGGDYAGSRINLSAVPDEVLFAYQREAWRRFYLNPGRIARIVRDYPKPWFLPYYLPPYLIRATKGIFGKRARMTTTAGLPAYQMQ
jgi:anaerobic magnesium-protoporphyrin IX monomethyl ester cyclase